jgi:hypothetical protein
VRRPIAVSGICVFFGIGTLICMGTLLALLFPGSALELWWRIKPQARTDFMGMGPWALVLMVVVATALALAAWGMWRGRSWGRVLSIGVLAVNGTGDLFTAVTRERTAAIGVIVAATLIAYLVASRSVGRFFGAD